MKQGRVLVGGRLELTCLVPETEAEYRKGLEITAGLLDTEGMLFRYGPEARDVFLHMAGVTFPLDVVFVKEGAVTGICHDVQPATRGRMYSFAQMALELPGGWCRRHYVDVGTIVEVVAIT